MRRAVLLTAGAEHDLEGIHDYIAEAESKRSADRTVGRDVVIVLIADGRREMLSLLERRLLAP